MEEFSDGLQRFLRSVTPATTGCAAVASILLYYAAWPVSGWLDTGAALRFVMPPKMSIVFTSQNELAAHLAQLPNLLALLPLLAWILSALQGAKSHTATSPLVFIKLIVILMAAAAFSACCNLWLSRYLLAQLASEPVSAGFKMEMISIADFEHWRWALRAAFATFVALGIVIVRKRRQPG